MKGRTLLPLAPLALTLSLAATVHNSISASQPASQAASRPSQEQWNVFSSRQMVDERFLIQSVGSLDGHGPDRTVNLIVFDTDYDTQHRVFDHPIAAPGSIDYNESFVDAGAKALHAHIANHLVISMQIEGDTVLFVYDMEQGKLMSATPKGHTVSEFYVTSNNVVQVLRRSIRVDDSALSIYLYNAPTNKGHFLAKDVVP